jgi:hypothetical protein
MSVVDHMTREELLRMQASARTIQEKYDNALAPWGSRADAKPLSQDVDEYHRNLAVRAKKLLPEGHKLRDIQFRGLRADAFAVLEPQLLSAVSTSAFHPTSVPQGTIQRREATDSNGHKVINWIGEESFVKAMGIPGRRVVSFFTGNQVYDAAKGRWR